MEQKKRKLNSSTIKSSLFDKNKGILLPTEMTNDLAYLCGVLAGDGHIVSYQNQIFCVGNPKDEKEFYDDTIAPLFKTLFNLNINPRLFKEAGTYGIRFDSKSIRCLLTDLVGLPRGRKHKQLKIPTIIKKDKFLLKNYLSGLFDTDFGFSFKKDSNGLVKYPSICFTTTNRRFCMEIRNVFNELGLKPNKVYKCTEVHSRTNKNYTWWRFDMNKQEHLLLTNKILRYRHPKHIKMFKKWMNSGRKI